MGLVFPEILLLLAAGDLATYLSAHSVFNSSLHFPPIIWCFVSKRVRLYPPIAVQVVMRPFSCLSARTPPKRREDPPTASNNLCISKFVFDTTTELGLAHMSTPSTTVLPIVIVNVGKEMRKKIVNPWGYLKRQHPFLKLP